MATRFAHSLPLFTLLAALLIPARFHFLQQAELTETFDDPALPGWERTPNAVVADGMLRIDGEGFALRPEVESVGGIVLRLRLEGEGFVEVRYRLSEAGMYVLRIASDETTLLREIGGQPQILASAPSNLPAGEWQLLELSLAGAEQHAFLTPGAELHAQDGDPLPPGGLMLHVFGDAVAEFDDLTLLAGGKAPAPEATAPPAEPPSPDAPPLADAPAADSPTWVRLGGPPGGLGYDIRYSFDDPDMWYVTDAYSGVHISTDNGFTWQPANEGIPPQAGTTGDAFPVFSLTVDPHDPDIVWAGTQGSGHIYRSTDRGWTWEQRDSGITIEHDGLSFRGFTIDPRSSDIVYALGEINSEALGGPAIWGNGTGGVIYRTLDAGLSWEKIWDGGIPSSLARYLWIDPSDPQMLYVSTGIFDRGAVGEGDPRTDPFGGLGVLVSADGGDTWQTQGESHGLRMLYMGSLYMHPENPQVLLAAAGHVITGIAEHVEYLRAKGETSPSGVYRTEDGGEHWTQVLVPPDDRMLEPFSAVEFCPGDPSIAYAASSARVYRSQDAGVTWTELPAGLTGWGPSGIVTGFPIDIQCDPRDADRLFINNYGGGNFLSEDGGKNWVSASQGYSGAILRDVAVHPAQPGTVYAAGPSGIWQSRDGGTSWLGMANSNSEAVLSLDWNTIVVESGNPQHLLLAGSPEVFESLDAGQTWHKTGLMDGEGHRLEGDGLAGLSPVSVIAYAPSDASVVYAGVADGSCLIYHEPCTATRGMMLLSQDSGARWTLVEHALPEQAAVLDLSVDPKDSRAVWAATQAGVYRSVDGGRKWEAVSQLAGLGRASALAVDPDNASHLLASIDRVGMWQSTDGGESWQAVAAGLEANAIIHDIAFDPTNPANVYAGDNASGVYRSTDGGTTWEQINQGLTMRAVTRLAIASDGQHLYVATLGGGVFRLDLNADPPVGEEPPEAPAEVPPAGEAAPGQPGEGAEPPPGLDLRAALVGIGLCASIVAAALLFAPLAARLRRKARP